jgi:hypothetical protein
LRWGCARRSPIENSNEINDVKFAWQILPGLSSQRTAQPLKREP